MQPVEMTEVIGGKRYKTEGATLLADDAYWDGHNFERRGTNTFLYRTPKGAYFVQRRTQWQGAHDTLEPLSRDEAMTLYESLEQKHVIFEEAFPGITVPDA